MRKLLSCLLLALLPYSASAQTLLEAYWQAGDGNDYANALDRAIPNPGEERCVSVKLANHQYRVSRQIDVTGCFHIEGDPAVLSYDRDATAAGGSFGVPTLWFYNNSGGFFLHTYVAICGATYPGMTHGSRFSARGIVIHGSGHLSGRYYNGITARARFWLDSVTIRQFGGYGVLMACNGTSAVTPNCGECSLSKVLNSRIYLNGWGGIRTESADANAGYFLGLDVNDNGERRYDYGADDVNGTGDDCPGAGCPQSYLDTIHQIEDNSLIGNKWIAIHVGGNTNGSNSSVTCQANRCQLIAPYFEGTQQATLSGPAWSLGGSLDRVYPTSTSSNGAYVNSDTTGLLFVENAIGARVAINQLCNVSGCVGANLGSTGTNNAALEIKHDTTASTMLRLQYQNSQTGWWEMIDSGSNSLTSLRLSAPTNVRAGRGQLWTPYGFYFGGGGADGALPTGHTSPALRFFTATIGSRNVFMRADKVAVSISGMTTSGSRTLVTASSHGFADGERVEVVGVSGCATNNGLWIIDYSSASQFYLNGSSGCASYTASTGQVQRVAASGEGYGLTAHPATGAWAIGDRIWAKGTLTATMTGWVVTATGTPGTWRAF